MSKFVIIAAICAFLCVISSSNGQFFGGKTNHPGGGFNQQAGFKAGPAWGSLSQDFNKFGQSGPITYGLGAGHTSPNNHGLSGSAFHNGKAGQATARGQIGLINTPNNQVTGWAQHDRSLDRHFKPVGPATNSAGLNFDNKGGANAFLSGSKTGGQPAVGTVGGSIPVIKNPTSSLNLGGQTTFGHGRKPDHQIGVTYEKTF